MPLMGWGKYGCSLLHVSIIAEEFTTVVYPDGKWLAESEGHVRHKAGNWSTNVPKRGLEVQGPWCHTWGDVKRETSQTWPSGRIWEVYWCTGRPSTDSLGLRRSPGDFRKALLISWKLKVFSPPEVQGDITRSPKGTSSFCWKPANIGLWRWVFFFCQKCRLPRYQMPSLHNWNEDIHGVQPNPLLPSGGIFWYCLCVFRQVSSARRICLS